MDYSNQKNEEEKQEFEFKYVETYKVIFVGDSGIGIQLIFYCYEKTWFYLVIFIVNPFNKTLIRENINNYSISEW